MNADELKGFESTLYKRLTDGTKDNAGVFVNVVKELAALHLRIDVLYESINSSMQQVTDRMELLPIRITDQIGTNTEGES